MRSKILEALKAKFEGVSEKILGRVADKLAKTITKEEDIQTAVDGVTFQQVLDSYGDARATEAGQTAVKNYETKHNLKDGEKVDPEARQTTTTTDEGSNSELLKAIESLRAEVADMKAEKQTSSRKAELQKLTASLPETFRKAYDRTPVDGMTDEEFQTLLTEVGGEVEAIGKESQRHGATFRTPIITTAGGQTKPNGATSGAGGIGGGVEATKEEMDAVATMLGI